ncbi:MAG: NAD(P)-dependent dehydrogenase (short-subunit alcohol dehydrogenase family) [Limisphaerales bacterium]|jgi:NAD(P)-dependent dehydrogenase (short-subunit alcohol dehydrogenase family)
MSAILITGANRGIGLELTRKFLSKGHVVVATARRPEEAQELLSLVPQSRPGALTVIPLDVTDADSANHAAKQCEESIDALDILINNAGIYPEGGDEPFSEIDVELFQRAMDVNYIGTVRVTQAFLPLLQKGGNARIVNISSGAATLTEKNDSRRYCYGPSKTALNMFTRTLANELKAEGIVVAAISPGWVRTEMGGEDADLSVEDSTTAMAETIANLSMESSGEFLDRFGKSDSYKW